MEYIHNDVCVRGVKIKTASASGIKFKTAREKG